MSPFVEEKDPILQSVIQARKNTMLLIVALDKLSLYMEVSQATHKTFPWYILKIYMKYTLC